MTHHVVGFGSLVFGEKDHCADAPKFRDATGRMDEGGKVRSCTGVYGLISTALLEACWEYENNDSTKIDGDLL